MKYSKELKNILEKENKYFNRGFIPLEYDQELNDLQREKIKTFYKQHKKIWLGNINSYQDKPVLKEYKGEKIYNFEYDFVIPVFDKQLIDMITDYQNTKYDLKVIAEKIDQIFNRVKKLNGLTLYWV